MSGARSPQSGQKRDWPHLQREHLEAHKKGAAGKLQPTLERREAWCKECANRVTCGSKEWGHDPDCSHRFAGGVR